MCTNQEHAYQQIFKCDQMNCEQFICRQCIGLQDNTGKRYCICCAANHKNHDAEEEEYKEGSGKVIGEFTRTIEVKRDKTTGEVIGWDDFF